MNEKLQDLANQKITLRQFLIMFGATGISTGLSILLSACGNQEETELATTTNNPPTKPPPIIATVEAQGPSPTFLIETQEDAAQAMHSIIANHGISVEEYDDSINAFKNEHHFLFPQEEYILNTRYATPSLEPNNPLNQFALQLFPESNGVFFAYFIAKNEAGQEAPLESNLMLFSNNEPPQFITLKDIAESIAQHGHNLPQQALQGNQLHPSWQAIFNEWQNLAQPLSWPTPEHKA